MTFRPRISRAFAAAVVALGMVGACDTGGLVGGECKDARIFCGGDCIDPQTDPENCGRCGNVCAPGLICSRSDCVAPGGAGGTAGAGGTGGKTGGGTGPGGAGGAGGSIEAGAPNLGGGGAGVGANGGSDTGGTGASSGQSQGGRAGSTGFGGAGGEGGLCFPPFKTADQCGACDVACAAPNPICDKDVQSGLYHCVPKCNPPITVECDSRCVDLNTDPEHCGKCFNLCPSGICSGGECVGASPGHVALYCMNYSWAQPQTAQTVLLTNAAIYLPRRSSVRILGFTKWAPAPVRNQVDSVIKSAGTATIATLTDPTLLSAQLTIQDYDVFLVYEQPDAPPGELATLGTEWADALQSFAAAGGVIIVLDGAQGVGEMPDLITGAGLLALDGHTEISPEDATTQFFVRVPTDQLATRVLSPLSPKPNSCTFDVSGSAAPDASFVVTNAAAPAAGKPVVIHRVVSR